MKWLARILLGVVVAVVAVLLMFALVTSTDRGGRWVGERVLALAGKSLTFDLQIGGMRGSGPSRWTLYEVRGFEKKSGKEFFRAHRVDLSIDWPAYLHDRRFEITNAVVDSLNANVWFDTSGVLHPVFPGADTTARTPAGPKKPLPLAIRDLNVKQVAFSFSDRGRQRTVKLYNSGIKGSGIGNEWNGNIEGWLSLQSPQTSRVVFGPVSLKADVANGNAQLQRLLWATNVGRLDGNGNWELASGKITAHAEGDANLDSIAVIVPAMKKLSGAGTYQLDMTRAAGQLLGQVSFDIQGFQLDSLKINGLSGVASTRGIFSGPLTNPDSLRGDLTFSAANFQAPGVSRGSVSGKAHLDRSIIDLSASGPGIDFRADGRVLGPHAPDLHFSSRVIDLDRFVGNRGYLVGDLSLNGTVTGTWAAPQGRATYLIPHLVTHGIADSNVHGEVSFLNSTIAFNVATARGITGQGRAFQPKPAAAGAAGAAAPGAASPGPWQGNISLNAPDFPLADLKPVLPPNWLSWFPEGHANLAADLNGTLAEPRGQIRLVGQGLRLKHNDVGVLTLTADVVPGEVRVTGNLTPARGSGQVQVDAHLPLATSGGFANLNAGKPLTARVLFNDLVFEATPPDSAPADTLPRHVAVRGVALVSVIPGHPASRRVSLDLDSLEIRSRRARLETRGPLRVQWADNTFALDTIKVEIWRNRPDTLAGVVEGSLAYDGRNAFSGGFTAGPIPLDLVSELLPGSPQLGGDIQAHVVPSGRFGAFGLEGDIDWTDASTAQLSFDRVRSRFRYSGSTITIDSLVASADTSAVRGGGVVTLGKAGAPAGLDLDFTTNGFSLASLPVPPASFRTLTGKMDGWLKVRGTMADPLYTGAFSIGNGAVQFGPMLAPVGGLEARVRLENSTVFIDSLRSKYNGGTGELAGRFTMSPGYNYGYDLTGSLDRLPLFLDPGIQLRLTGPVSLKGTTDRSQLAGNFHLTDGHYVEKFDLQRLLLRRQIVQVRSSETARLLDGMNLNLRINSGYEDFMVDNNVARIPMSLDLLILGTALDWRMAGTAEAEPDSAGKIFYLDRIFKVGQLTATFDNPRRPDPLVDMIAATDVTSDEAEREDYAVTLSYTGRASEFRPNLTSDPPLPQPDVVALLTLGVPIASLGIGSGTSTRAGDVFLNRARDLTTRGILQLAGRRAADFVGVSRIQLSAQQGNVGNTALTVGQDFGKKVSIDYTTSLTDPGVPRLDMNWKLTNRFSLRSIAAQEGASSVDLRYAFWFW